VVQLLKVLNSERVKLENLPTVSLRTVMKSVDGVTCVITHRVLSAPPPVTSLYMLKLLAATTQPPDVAVAS
jgi:hypothetical protein